jgi:uncharacterized protein (DUF433 family)
MWESCPEIFQQVTVAAIDEGQITTERGAQILGLSAEEMEAALTAFRQQELKRSYVVVTDGCEANLADGGLPVAEIVRVYRKVGSIEKLREAFVSVSPQSLQSALAYAEAHPEEIDVQISRYEALLGRRLAEHPFG